MPATLQPDRLREYYWAIQSPPLFDETYLNRFTAYHTLVSPSVTLWRPISTGIQAPGPDKSVLSERLTRTLSGLASHFLGARFESLWQVFFQNHPEYDLLHHNLQVFDQNGLKKKSATLGEFDFLVSQPTAHTTWHIEATVKYYLGLPDEQWRAPDQRLNTQWLGPNCIDTLERKLTTALSRQLKLSETPDARKLLEQLNIPAPRPALLTRGELFSPLMIPESQDWEPEEGLHINPTLRWTRQSKLSPALEYLAQRFGVTQWVPLPKAEWLGLTQYPENHFLKWAPWPTRRREILDLIEKEHRPWLLAGLSPAAVTDSTERDPILQQVCRLFITPDDWPQSRP